MTQQFSLTDGTSSWKHPCFQERLFSSTEYSHRSQPMVISSQKVFVLRTSSKEIFSQTLPTIYTLRAGYVNDFAQRACTLSGVEG